MLNLLAYGGQMLTQDALANAGLLYGPAVAQGQWWRLVSSGFLHGGLIHIGFNMYLLFMMGPQLEKGFGALRFFLIYFGALLGGAATVVLFDWQQPTLGASGAVLGLAGTLGIVYYFNGISLQRSPVFGLVLLNLGLPLLLPGISFWGHFGGVVCGVIMGVVFAWLPRKVKVSEKLSIGLGVATVILFTVLGVVGATAIGISKGM